MDADVVAGFDGDGYRDAPVSATLAASGRMRGTVYVCPRPAALSSAAPLWAAIPPRRAVACPRPGA